MKNDSDVLNRFVHHPPQSEETVKKHEVVRGIFIDVVAQLLVFVPPGRDQALMLTKLEEALFHANAAIARNQ